MSCFLCEPMETVRSLGDGTHAVVTRVKGGMRARISQCECMNFSALLGEWFVAFSVVLCVGGLSAGFIGGGSNKDTGRSNHKTPTLCANEKTEKHYAK